MIPKERDVAKTADWSFCKDEALVKKLGGQARELAYAYGLDAEDLLQETLLWLAVRPELQRKSHGMILGRTRTVSRDMSEKERRHDHDELSHGDGDE